ncbi:MAG: hypothetical protein JWP69_2426 [Flaviaesturariibacter sp.]|nr:hypothetical protein [Flaviaesturariibacter sp.]
MRFGIRKIVFVDDDPDDCFIFRKALADVSSTVQLHFVSDCDVLIQTLDAIEPDLVFMDINMPKKSGFECISEIRGLSRYEALPVVMYSCAEQNVQIQKAYGFGAHLYLQKPSSYGALVSSIRTILAMDWDAPQLIADSYFTNGEFLPFKAV